jgi:hypothetical protein
MVAAAPLGDVVQQAGRIERAPGLQLPDQLRSDGRDFRQLAPLDLMQDADRLDRVLVDGEDMVGVELHQPDDARPVRDEARQEPRLVHQPQPERGVAAGEDVEEEGIRLRLAAQRGGVVRVADQRADRQRMDLHLPVARRLDDAQHQHRLAREVAVWGCGHQLAVGERKARLGQRRVALAADGGGAERGALDRRLQHAGQPQHVAHREEQVLHEALDAVLPAARRIAHARTDHGLEVEGQPLLRPPGDVVEVEADGPEEVPGAADGARLVLGEEAAARAVLADQLRHALGAEGVAGEPVEGLQVAQAAAPLLHMRLDQEGAVAVSRMAPGPLLPLGGEEGAEAAFPPLRVEGGAEAAEDRPVADQEAAVDEGGEHRRIAPRLLHAVADAARRMADLQPEIPEQVEDELHHPLRARPRLLVGEEEQVDIGEGRQHAAAIAAGCDEGEGRLRLLRRIARRDHGEGIGVDGAHQPVDQRGQPARGGQAVQLMAFEGVLHPALDATEMAAQQVEGLLAPQGARHQFGDQVGKDPGRFGRGMGPEGLAPGREGRRFGHSLQPNATQARLTAPSMRLRR